MFIDIYTLVLFAISVAALTLIPGADMLCALSNTISQGTKAGLITVLGSATGVMCHISLAIAGITALIASSPMLYALFVYIGALYLMWAGFSIFNNKSAINLQKNMEHKKSQKLYLQGLLTNLLNPKAIIFTLVFIPQFIRNEAGKPSMQMLTLGIEMILIMVFIGIALVFLVQKITMKISTNTCIFINKSLGAFIVILAIGILVSHYF